MARKNSKIKQKEKNRVTHDQKDILIAKLFKELSKTRKVLEKALKHVRYGQRTKRTGIKNLRENIN